MVNESALKMFSKFVRLARSLLGWATATATAKAT